jgi:hypothetical protein
MSAADAIITVSFAVSLVLSGLVLRAVGPQNVYAIGGLTALAGALVLTPVFRAGRATTAETAMSEAAIEQTAGG